LQNKKYLEEFIQHEISQKSEFLIKNHYLSNNKLTLKGTIATLFKEMESTIGTEIVFSEYVDHLDEKEYVSLLVFISEGSDSENFEIPHQHVYEYVTRNFHQITPNRKDAWAIQEWYEERHITEITKQYNIFEGDLIKIIHKIINYIDELKEAYILKNDLKKVELLVGIEKKMEREVVSTESLYLKL
jgi:superfamily II RNA helicase